MSSVEPGNRAVVASMGMVFAPGATLGSRYTLDRTIGTGGYSEVWAAHDAVLDRPVAIKVLHAEYAQSADALRRFRTEAQLAGRLSDANVARVYDFCDTSGDGPAYLVMEFIDGPTLAEMLRGGPLNPARTMDILAQSAAGLHAAHSAGLVHRDIKPSNIMIAPGNVVKITDFGLSHSLASAPITRTGMIAGTPSFMAPERSAGARATPASDLYSLGVLGYECLAGAPPFEGTPLEVTLAHRFGVFPPLPAATPVAVSELIAWLTARDPADRPDDAETVARQAAQLRDALLTAPPGYGPATPPGYGPATPPGYGPATPPGYGPATPPGYGPATTLLPESAPPPPHGAPPDSTGPAQHTLIVAASPVEPEPEPARRRTGAAIGWLVAVTAGAAAVAAIIAIALSHGGDAPAAAAQRPAASGGSAIRAVEVSRSALIGEPVTQAAQRLRNEGFQVRILWWPAPAQPPSTVIAVRPAGLRPPGSVITLVAAFRPGQGRHHDHQHGGVNGNGQGDGNNPGNGTD
jgi:eukaryotic-like serine/threonine-protein kinase